MLYKRPHKCVRLAVMKHHREESVFELQLNVTLTQHSPAASVTYLSKRLVDETVMSAPPLWRWLTGAAAIFSSIYIWSMWSDRRGAIFGACCGGCFYLTHPPGLVFKPWPSGSGVMRKLFQSGPPLKARQSLGPGHRKRCPSAMTSSLLPAPSQINLDLYNHTLVCCPNPAW